MRQVILFAFVGILGCASTAHIEQKRDETVSAADQEFREGWIDRDCPSVELLTADCGLVTKYVRQPAFVKRFVQKVCKGEVDDRCQDKFVDMMFARFEDRYNMADPAKVNHWCRANPMDCEEMVEIELAFMRDHNGTLAQRRDQKVATANARRDTEVEADAVERRRRFAEGMQAAAAAMKRDTFTCRPGLGDTIKCTED